MATLWAAAVDALVADMRAVAGYQAPDSAGTGTPVYDGPEVFLARDLPAKYLVVGDPGVEGAEDGGSAGQASGPMAANAGRPRDETGTIRCRAVAQSGDVGVKAVRDAALTVVADVETLLRVGVGAPTLGIVAQRFVAQVTDLSWSQYTTDRGVACEIPFVITYQARI